MMKSTPKKGGTQMTKKGLKPRKLQLKQSDEDWYQVISISDSQSNQRSGKVISRNMLWFGRIVRPADELRAFGVKKMSARLTDSKCGGPTRRR